ncbi:MAG: phosphotransferase family protein [Candidatus Thorarchaeota archaeon]|jgi:aminoglycoside phosphotransferase (APT) family kinase protein
MDETRLSSYLSQNFSNKSNLRLTNISHITEGWETEIYSIDIEYVAENNLVHEGLILRMYPGRHASHNARKEYLLLQGLNRVEYPVPRVFLVEEDSSQLGAPFIVMERITGQTMGIALRESPTQQSRLGALFSELFVNLHNLEWQEVIRDFDPKPSFSVNEVIGEQLTNYEHEIAHYKREEFIPILEWLRAMESSVSCERLSLTHRDFHPFNIMMDETGKPFVIDWTSANISDYRVDLGWTLLLIGAFSGKEIRDSTLEGYERLIGKQVEEIEYFEILAALRRLFDVSVSLSTDAGERDMRDGAAEMMKETLDHLVYVENLVEEHTGIGISIVEELKRSLT